MEAGDAWYAAEEPLCPATAACAVRIVGVAVRCVRQARISLELPSVAS